MSTDPSRLVVSDSVARLILAAEVTGEDSELVRERVSSELRQPLSRFVIDLSACKFLDPEAVDLIGSVMGVADQRDIPIVLEGASATVRVILGIAGLLDFPADRGEGGS